jgi:hypothetical protein
MTDFTSIFGKPWWERSDPTAPVAPIVPAAAAAPAPPTNASQQQLTLALALLKSIQTEVSQMAVETDALRAQIATTAQVVQQAVSIFQKLANPQITPAEIVAATGDLATATAALQQAMTAASAAIAPAGAAAATAPAPAPAPAQSAAPAAS